MILKFIKSVYWALILSICLNVFHALWQLAVMIWATVKWSWIGLGISFAALLLFNILEALVWYLYNKKVSAQKEALYERRLEG